MSYNDELQNNNADLQAILDEVNALPEMPDTVEQATPTISVDANGLITAEAVQTAGYVEAGTKSATHQLLTQPGETVAPGTEEQTIVEAGTFVTGDIKVAAVESGGGTSSPVESDVNFYDFDGTLLYAYTLEEAQALTELPTGPDWHEELVFAEWNWSLEGINKLDYKADIGALYDTRDGATHLNVVIEDFARNVTMHLKPSVAGGVEIDWGDGTDSVTLSTAGQQSVEHTFAASGEYCIRVYTHSGSCKFGADSTTMNIWGDLSASVQVDTTLRSMHMGRNTSLSKHALRRCVQLMYITLSPNGGYHHVDTSAIDWCRNLRWVNVCNHNTPVNTSAFESCTSLCGIVYGEKTAYILATSARNSAALKIASAPKNAIFSEGYIYYSDSALRRGRGRTSTGNTAAFYNCSSLTEFEFADASTGVGQQMFYNCYSLRQVVLPEAVEKIQAQAFYNCYSMARLCFRALTPPTVANANAFTGIPTTCVVEVPAASLEAYQNATNYSGIAAQMVGGVT